jgi:L-2,4-diaminobutyrate decarboxylase
VFESKFLTQSEGSKDEYRRLLAQAAEIVVSSLRDVPYVGKTPAALAGLVNEDFLPESPRSNDEIVNTLRTVVANSIAVAHPHTAAHLHCPPLLSALAAEVVIGALNQSMDSFDQAPIATVVEQKLIRWLCTEAGLPSTANGTFTTGGSQSNYMGLLLARDAFCLAPRDDVKLGVIEEVGVRYPASHVHIPGPHLKCGSRNRSRTHRSGAFRRITEVSHGGGHIIR